VKVERIQTPLAGEVVNIELTCEDFDGERPVRYTNKCSEGCSEGLKMFFTPRLPSSTIHAVVCAGRWEFVNKLSKEWWARKAGEVLGWDEDKIRQQTDPEWAARLMKSTGRKSSSGEHNCIGCGKRVSRGQDLCSDCIEGAASSKGADFGSIDDL